MKVCVAIPAYNAAATIEDVVRRVHATGHADRVLVVDDGSTDDTARIVARMPDVRLVRHDGNQGYGAAQRTLLRTFLDDADFEADDAVVFLHADGEMLPEELPLLIAPLQQDPRAECVTGSRDPALARRSGFTSGGVARPPWKVALDRALTVYLNTAFGLSLTTYFGGYRALRKSAVPKVPVHLLAPNHFFDIEFLAFGGASLRMVEVPISNIENHSVSNYSSVLLLRNILLFGLRFPEVRRTARAHERAHVG